MHNSVFGFKFQVSSFQLSDLKLSKVSQEQCTSCFFYFPMIQHLQACFTTEKAFVGDSLTHFG